LTLLWFWKIKTRQKIDVTDTKVTEYSADHIIIATGARSRVNYLNLPQDGVKVLDIDKLPTIPTQINDHVGSGAISRVAHSLQSNGNRSYCCNLCQMFPVEDEDNFKWNFE
jgi:dihydrolipoamide dehydrogenase